MQTMIRRPCLVLLIMPLVAFFASAPAASAQEAALVGLLDGGSSAAASEQAFTMDLAAVVAVDDLAAPAESAVDETPVAVRAVQLVALEAFADPNAWRATQASEANLQQNQSSGGGGFGRWLKKRWYIPVLAAVVIGVTIADDDDASGDDED